MATFLSNINLAGNQIQNATFQKVLSSSLPTSPFDGQLVYTTDTNEVLVYHSSAWHSISGDITSITAGAGLTGTSLTGDVTLNVGQGDGISVLADAISVSANSSYFEFISGALSIKSGSIGSNELSSTTVTAGSYGSATTIPTFTVDEDGRLTAAGFESISTTLEFSVGGPTNDTVLLGTDVLSFLGGDGIDTSLTGSTGVNIAVDSTVVRTSGDQTIAGNKTFSNDVVVGGNFTVNGTVTTVNTEEVNIADNIIVLNSNETGTPTQNAGIEVERGTGDNVQLFWDEAAKRWKQNYLAGPDILYTSLIPVEGEYNNYTFFVNGDTGSHPVANGEVLAIVGGDGIDTAATTGSGIDTVTITHADTSSYAGSAFSGLTVINGITVDQFGHTTGASSADLTADVDGRITAREFKASIGDGVATTYTVTHNLGTRDVIVQLFDNSSYDTVFADVVRTTINTVDVSFAVAPALNDIRVLITKIG